MSTVVEGSLYELIARGKKDEYFYGDDSKSSFLFDNSYLTQTPMISELRRIPPISTSEFGRTVEFVFDLVGDVMKTPSILIDLPTWLPPAQAELNRKSIVEDSQGITYGYTQSVGYFLFETIQFFQDNILLQEFSGDTLWALSMNSGTYSRGFITMDETGGHDGTARSIQKNATLSQLRLELPLLGCQRGSDGGFPQRGATRHSYRLRCKLRKLEDLVESSDGRQKPVAWNVPMTLRDGKTAAQTFTTLKREQIGPLKLQLETTQIFVEKDMQTSLERVPTKVRFTRVSENVYTEHILPGTFQIKRRVDGRHPTSRLLWFFRSRADILSNRLYKINTTDSKAYFNTVGLVIAGTPRESPREPGIWRDVVNYAKEDTDSGLELYTMNWTLGNTPRGRDELVTATGAVNFTTADKPTILIDFVNPGLVYTVEITVIQEGWAQFQTDGKGGAELFSFN